MIKGSPQCMHCICTPLILCMELQALKTRCKPRCNYSIHQTRSSDHQLIQSSPGKGPPKGRRVDERFYFHPIPLVLHNTWVSDCLTHVWRRLTSPEESNIDSLSLDLPTTTVNSPHERKCRASPTSITQQHNRQRIWTHDSPPHHPKSIDAGSTKN